MNFDTILSAIAGALSGGVSGYSFMEDLEREERERRNRTNMQGLELMGQDAERMHRADRERIGDERYNDTRRRENAGVMASLLEPNQDIDEGMFADLEGTPFEARVNTTSTLPSRTVPGTGVNINDAGGRTSRTWRPTAAQSKTMAYTTRKRELLGTLPVQARRVAEANDLGINVSASDLQTPEEKARLQAEADARAFGEFTRREDYQDKLVRGRDRRRESLEDLDPHYARDKGEYDMFVRTHDKQQESRTGEIDPLTGKEKKRAYDAPLTFEQWRAKEKGRGPLARRAASLPLEMRPMPSHRSTRPQPMRSHGTAPTSLSMPKPNDVVTVRGKQVKVTKVNADGTIEGVPIG